VDAVPPRRLFGHSARTSVWPVETSWRDSQAGQQQ